MTRLLVFGLSLFFAIAGGRAHGQSPTQDVAPEQDGFGRAVAVGEAGAFVGAPQAVNNPGRVYTYTRDETGVWQERDFLEARQGRVGDAFGSVIEASGELLVVGAPSANAVYVFRREDSGWTQAARLTPTDSTSRFGRSLALQGDRLFVGTGTTFVVEQGDTTNTGAVHLFQQREDGGWSEDRVFRSDQVQGDAGFGHTLTALPNHLLVGAPQHNGGAVVAFGRGTDGWTESQTLTADPLGSNAQFGAALQWAGDQLLVGAPRAFDATGAVDVYTYSTQDTTWRRTDRLRPSENRARHYFGHSLAYDGTDVWVGAPDPIRMTFFYQWRAQRSWPGGAQSENGSGAVYRFRPDGDSWTEADRLQRPGAESGDGLGGTLAANASVVVAGLPGDDYGAGTMGLYSIRDGAWTDSTPRVPTQGTVFSTITGDERACSGGTVGPFFFLRARGSEGLSSDSIHRRSTWHQDE